ncbi:hypothetical protein [Streptomyces sp. NPDC001340]
MSAVITLLFGAAMLTWFVYDTVRLVTPYVSRCPPLARLRGRRATLEAVERRSTGLLLHGRITAAEHRARMSRLAHGERPPGTTRHSSIRGGGRHG